MGNSITIIGAGLTGLMAALHLAQRNIPVKIYEKRSLQEITKKRYTASGQIGRSMSMDISARGLFALDAIDSLQQIVENSVPMTHKIFHEHDGTTLTLPYGQHEHENILTVSRTHLFNTLVERCMLWPNIEIEFEHMLIDIDFSFRSVTLFDSSSMTEKIIYPQVVIGADGTNSRVRALIGDNGVAFKISYFPMSYKELTIPASHAEGLSSNAMHKWARNNAMLVAQPNNDGSFTCALLLPERGQPYSFNSINSACLLRRFFKEQFPQAFSRMPDLEAEYFRNPVGRMKIIRGNRWSRGGFALLMGDAAHGMVPFFGQGVNCCFEDCTFLAQCVDQYDTDWSSTLEAFDMLRAPEANAINSLSYENYPELFSFEQIGKIQLVRKIESLLMEKHDRYRSYHNLICFERVPYTFVQRVKAVQTQLLSRLSERVDGVEQIDNALLEHELAIYEQELAMIKGPGL